MWSKKNKGTSFEVVISCKKQYWLPFSEIWVNLGPLPLGTSSAEVERLERKSPFKNGNRTVTERVPLEILWNGNGTSSKTWEMERNGTSYNKNGTEYITA